MYERNFERMHKTQLLLQRARPAEGRNQDVQRFLFVQAFAITQAAQHFCSQGPMATHSVPVRDQSQAVDTPTPLAADYRQAWTGPATPETSGTGARWRDSPALTEPSRLRLDADANARPYAAHSNRRRRIATFGYTVLLYARVNR